MTCNAGAQPLCGVGWSGLLGAPHSTWSPRLDQLNFWLRHRRNIDDVIFAEYRNVLVRARVVRRRKCCSTNKVQEWRSRVSPHPSSDKGLRIIRIRV